MKQTYIRCPKCTWEPDETCIWVCSVCKTRWNTFDTHGECPGCGEVYRDTQCIRSKNGCGQFSSHKDWYVNYIESKQAAKSLMFWKKEIQYPVSSDVKIWIELSLRWIAGKFEPAHFQSIPTLEPRNLYTKHDFKNSEEDAQILLKEIGNIVNVDTSNLSLVFLAVESEGMTEEELTAVALEATGNEVSRLNFEPVPNVLWIYVGWLDNIDVLVTALAQKLIRRKMLFEFNTESTNGAIVALTAVALGFGIFMGNSYLEFAPWQSAYQKGWRTEKNGYLPEQAIAYAMAWLAHCRNEDVLWKQYLNKTTLKYFERSYQYITLNMDQVNW